jgi:type II secretory pathway predicted ATPase ExeA
MRLDSKMMVEGSEQTMNNETKEIIPYSQNRNEHFGFLDSPFDYQSQIRFFFSAPSRQRIMDKILSRYQDNFISLLIVGRQGTGKTHLAQVFTSVLSNEDKVVLKYYAPLEIPGRDENLKMLLEAFDLEWQYSYDRSFQALKDFLVHQVEIHKPVFLIVYQGRPKRIFANEHIFDLLNLRYAGQPVLHIVWLTAALQLGLDYIFPRLIENTEYLRDMKYREMAGMIKFRSQVSGRKTSPFTTEALKCIHRLTHGNPGKVIRLCDFALDEAYFERNFICAVENVEKAWETWIKPNPLLND